MKAVIFNPKTGRPEIGKWPNPVPGSQEVVVKIHAAALNHRDIHIKNSPFTKEAFVFGSDGAGEVVEVGAEVANIKIGDQVVLNTYISCLKCDKCLNGQHTLCPNGRVLGGLSWPGTFAEYVKVPASNVERKPMHLDFVHSAAAPLSLGTAWRAMMTKADLKPSDTVLIQGIGGGVALYCMQIAVHLGCKVVVTSSSNEKIEQALQMGATAGINYREEDVVGKLEEFNGGEGFDIVLSSYGGSVPLSMDAAKVGGKIIQFSYLGGNLSEFEIDKLMGKQLTLIGTGDHTYQEFRQALQFIESKKIIPTVSKVFRFEEIGDAFQLMEEGKQFGKLVLNVTE